MISLKRQRVARLISVACLFLVAPVALAQTLNLDSSRPCDTVPAGYSGTNPCPQSADMQTADQQANAQQSGAQQPVDQQQGSDQNAPAQKPQLSTRNTATPALNGGPPIRPDEGRFRLLYGASTTQGYDSSVSSPFVAPIDSYFGSYEGYIAATWQFVKNYIVLQHDTTYTFFGSDLVKGNGFHHSAALLSGEFNPNLNWALEAHSSEGDNSLTLFSPLPATIVGGVPVPTPGAVLVGLNEGFVWGTDVVGTLNWKVNRRNSFSFRAENANRQFFDLNLHDNQAIFSAQYKRALSEKTYIGLYGITRHQTGTVECDNVGFGALASTRPTERLLLEASGGPEFDTSGCRRHQGFDLHLSATYRFRPRLWGFAMANREYSSGFLPNGTWEDNIGAGFRARLTRNVTWEAFGGYLRGYTTGFILPPASINSYYGFYAQTSFTERLSSSFTLEEVYRRFDDTSAGLTGHRNMVFVTLRWSPRNHDAWRTETYPYSPGETLPEHTPRSDRED